MSVTCRSTTDSYDIFSEVRFLSDDSKVYYCTGLPVSEMLRLAFDFVLRSFFGGENVHFTGIP